MQRHTIFHFKAFAMVNLHYVIRIYQKVYNDNDDEVYQGEESGVLQ